MENIKLTTEQLDALKEIGNIGAGNSATALSQLLGKKISVDIPQVALMRAQDLSKIDLAKQGGELSTAVSLKILGKLSGGIIVLFPQRSTLLLVDMLMKKPIGSTQVFSLADESVLTETASILCCSYLNAIAQFLNLYQLIPSITGTFVDTMENLSNVIIKRFIPSEVNYILPIENRLTVEDIELNLFVLFLLEPASFKTILKGVGL